MVYRNRFMKRAAVISGVFALLSLGQQSRAEPIDTHLSQRIMTLTKATVWTQVAAIHLPFKTFHPQGMVRIGDNFYVSSVEIRTLPKKMEKPLDGHDYDAGVGVGHLFKIGPTGELLSDVILGGGSIYHPGGIDYDGTSIWVPVAEYRPESHAIVYKVAPGPMTVTKVLTVADHIGGVVHDTDSHRIVGLSWGSRRIYDWQTPRDGQAVAAATAKPVPNPENFIDYQDCHYAGERRMLCSGVATYRTGPDKPYFQLGGLDLVDLSTHRTVWQTPIALWSPSGRAMTQNPFWVEVTTTGLRAYFMPDDDDSTVFVFETTVK